MALWLRKTYACKVNSTRYRVRIDRHQTVGIKLNTVAEHLSTVGDNLERPAIADTGIKCRGGLVWEQEKPANPLGFGQGQG
jgi:hypothetical protein